MNDANRQHQGSGLKALLFIVWGAVPILVIYKIFGWKGYLLLGLPFNSMQVAIRVANNGGPHVFYMYKAMQYVWRKGLFIFFWQMSGYMTAWFYGFENDHLVYSCPDFECMQSMVPKVRIGELCLVKESLFKLTQNGWAMIKPLDGMNL